MHLGPRSSGILLHPTSLPGRLGIGTLGAHAARFADELERMGQRWWQMLPIGPTGYRDSPYQSPSTFAGNPLLVDFDLLVADGLADERWLDDTPTFPDDEVDFGAVIPWRMSVLAAVAASFDERAGSSIRDELGAFERRHGPVWLDDFALFTAIKRAEGLRPWWEWDRPLVRRDPAALRQAADVHARAVRRVRIEQFLFDRQFVSLRAHCRRRGVSMIGDIPIFVAHDSADVWANPELFILDDDGMPTVIAGVPPDYFSTTGQRWGNPLYRWEIHEETGFAWWTERLRRMFDLFELVRVDHFRGFAASWQIPASEPTAENGSWVEAPGEALFEHLRREFGDLPVIAEDLGIITEDVEELRDRFGFPGMKVLQFGFGAESAHVPEAIGEHVVAYTGTHDNDTALGWLRDPDPEHAGEHATALEYFGTDGSEFNWDMIGAVLASDARIAVVPLQDVLGLGSEGRMNTPGTDSGNWSWRFRWSLLDDATIACMRTLTEETGRA